MHLDTWVAAVPLLQQGYHQVLLDKICKLRKERTIYPPEGQELYALEVVPFHKVNVIIVGQDPYHGANQAHGLAFSVPEGIRPPPSLRNILKEVEDDVYGGAAPPHSTDLTRWARQGVLLLNTTLTVEAGKPGSHRNLGWTRMTNAIIMQLSRQRDHLVFMLWGRAAQLKVTLIDATRHLILKAPHPSPLSAYRGFFGCHHFSQANVYLVAHGHTPIEW